MALLRNRTPSRGQDRVPWKLTSPPLHGHPPSAGLRLPKGEGLSIESARSPTFGEILPRPWGGLWFGLPQGEAGFYRAADVRLKRVFVFDLLTKKDTLPRYTDSLSREGCKCVTYVRERLFPMSKVCKCGEGLSEESTRFLTKAEGLSEESARSPAFGGTSPPQRGRSYKWRSLRKRARDDGN